MKTTELQGAALDWAVEKANGGDHTYNPRGYSMDWAFGGPIMEREHIQPSYQTNGKRKGQVGANMWQEDKSGALVPNTQYGPTYLIAAMRCYVASKLGDEVEIPEDLK